MRLLRVQVPEFRALRDVDITFDESFTPSVFPIGSQNGGGKSTLLQLIFTLLHCPPHLDRSVFLKNILDGFKVDNQLKILARFCILDDGKEIIIEFFATNDNIQIAKYDILQGLKKPDENVFYSSVQRLEHLSSERIETKELREVFVNYLERITEHSERTDFDEKDSYYSVREILSELDDDKKIRKLMPKSIDFLRRISQSGKSNGQFTRKIIFELSGIISDLDLSLEKIIAECIYLSAAIPFVSSHLEQENLNFICTYNSSASEDAALLCRCLCDQENHELILNKVSERIFLAAPSTQIFIFTSKESQKLLFKGNNQTKKYYSLVKNSEAELPGLFTYDFLSVDLLIDAFKTARDQDFRAAVKHGEYGNSYQLLISDLNLILGNKKINVSPDLSEIFFKLPSSLDEDEIDLFPENLSHGELKRLSLYMWLRSRLIEDSIVLMDEVEIAFHPDWQYQIVSDLVNWAPNNQYILATHSYEICQAVTPAHVKELEPKLIKAKNQ
jgi:predicted ATP-dependent endonuclease of OLD family